MSEPLPPRLEPQLLVAVKEAPEGDGWIHEVKYDGYRLLARVEGGEVRLFTRGGHDWTARLPTVAAAVRALGLSGGAWLDGELVALGPGGIPDFGSLHAAMRRRRGAPALVFQVWDAPWLDGRCLRGRCVLERKARLEERVRGRCEGGVVRWCDHLRGSGPALHRQAAAMGLEGIVSKRVGSAYRDGVRSRDWRKVKCYHAYRFHVAGHTPRLDEVMLCYRQDDGRLASAGRIPGWARAEVRQALRRALAPLRRPGAPVASAGRRREPVVWVEPAVEVEVRALAWHPGQPVRHAVLQRVVTPEGGG
jgi:bifunctional non-homologous end joining protein LigD